MRNRSLAVSGLTTPTTAKGATMRDLSRCLIALASRGAHSNWRRRMRKARAEICVRESFRPRSKQLSARRLSPKRSSPALQCSSTIASCAAASMPSSAAIVMPFSSCSRSRRSLRPFAFPAAPCLNTSAGSRSIASSAIANCSRATTSARFTRACNAHQAR